MNVDPATLASFGITFYGDEQQANVPEYGLTNPILAQMEACFSYTADFLNVPEQSIQRAVSPALSDILHEISVPEGIVPLASDPQERKCDSKFASDPQEDLSDAPHYELCDACHSEDDAEPPEDAFAIPVSDDESDSSQPAPEPTAKVRGRKRLVKEKVVPGKWHCRECSRNFMSKSGLSQHFNTRHSRFKPHKCSVCSKRFDRLDEKETHQARHKAENKPFGCSFDGCNRRFIHRHDRDRHFVTRHGEAPHPCEICRRGFGRKDQLEKHRISHKHNTNFLKVC